MKILLGVTGSISAYRALDLVRGLSKVGHEVSVVLSSGALKFVVSEAFYYLGARQVYLPSSDFEREKAGVLHIDLAREHDLFVLAPASANMLSKLASGSADDTLSSLLLALRRDRDVLIFPSMNPDMWNAPATISTRELLSKRHPNFYIFAPAGGEMACGEIGEGKLPSVAALLTAIECWPFHQKRRGRRVLITTGSTIAALDPVRFITNPSSGKTGVALAREHLCRGDQVTLICGHGVGEQTNELQILPGYKEIRVQTTNELFQAVKNEIESAESFISAGAPCDFLAPEVASSKLKKETSSLSFQFEKATDVLAWVCENYRAKVMTVGFAAESELTQEMLESKWQRKPTDFLVGTKVSGSWMNRGAAGFGAEGASYLIRNADGSYQAFELSKVELAKLIASWEKK